jgi:transposase-like protein
MTVIYVAVKQPCMSSNDRMLSPIQTKSPRGRRKSVDTRGFACPNPNCRYCGICHDTVHALVGYGHHNRIQRFKCQACGQVFTSRIGTPLYYLKTSPDRIEMMLWFLAEGVDLSVMIRFTGHTDATIARWLNRMGNHSQSWHNQLFRDLVFVVLQLDERYTRVRGIASARWLWLAIDPVSKAIPSLHIGGRSKHNAFALAHDIQIRLRSGHIPAFLTDGLRTYFYAITAHFGHWFRPPHARKDHWQPSDQLHHGMLIKRKHKKRKTITQTRMAHGKCSDLVRQTANGRLAAAHPDRFHRARQPHFSPVCLLSVTAHLGLCPI